MAATLAPPAPAGVYNIGTGEASTLRQAATILHDLVPGSDITVGPGLLPAKHLCLLDITRSRTDVGYTPRSGLREGLADCLLTLREYERHSH